MGLRGLPGLDQSFSADLLGSLGPPSAWRRVHAAEGAEAEKDRRADPGSAALATGTGIPGGCYLAGHLPGLKAEGASAAERIAGFPQKLVDLSEENHEVP